MTNMDEMLVAAWTEGQDQCRIQGPVPVPDLGPEEGGGTEGSRRRKAGGEEMIRILGNVAGAQANLLVKKVTSS